MANGRTSTHCGGKGKPVWRSVAPLSVPRCSEVPLENNLIVMERQPLEKQRCSPFLSQPRVSKGVAIPKIICFIAIKCACVTQLETETRWKWNSEMELGCLDGLNCLCSQAQRGVCGGDEDRKVIDGGVVTVQARGHGGGKAQRASPASPWSIAITPGFRVAIRVAGGSCSQGGRVPRIGARCGPAPCRSARRRVRCRS